ncbi:hypothetical protein DPMN_086295 [Dreissena polymorpha]|uniref:Uncharacterized protein n=1 Tax=Dreissena polymorpha TaxID=45954 RepID=A0A9D4KQX1_DREPO|nr:hypothetical protein DPMN_086295 [Dreissena polymorpha]
MGNVDMDGQDRPCCHKRWTFKGSSANSVGGDSGQDRRPETDRHTGASLSLYTYMYPRLYPIYLRPTMNNRAIMEGATSLTPPSIAFSSIKISTGKCWSH